jgi:hypothetical protein
MRVERWFAAAVMLTVLSSTALAALTSRQSTVAECVAEIALRFPESEYNPAAVFCGTDGRTYHATVNATVPIARECFVGVLRGGACECPNNCTAGLHGVCAPAAPNASTSQCKCHAGWGGSDCNTPLCAVGEGRGDSRHPSTNNCSGHGRCTSDAVVIGGGYCECHDGWTGPDCGTRRLATSDTPWGCPLPPQHGGEGSCSEPGRYLPWFDFQGFMQIRVQMNVEDLVDLLNPKYMLNNTHRPANVSVISNSHGWVKSFSGIGVTLKGMSSRLDTKKGLNLHLKHAHATPGDNDWPHKLSLKAGPALIGAQLSTTMFQTIGIPVPRTSFALLYINDAYYGVYMMMGDFTRPFVDYWYGPNASDVGYFRKAMTDNWWQDNGYNNFKPPFTGESGSHYNAFCAWIANSSQAEFDRDFATWFDVDSYARMLTVSSFLQIDDSVVGGNNYQVYHSAQVPFSLSARDFDQVFADARAANVTAWPVTTPQPHPLASRAFNSSRFLDLYSARYATFLNGTFHSILPTAPVPPAWMIQSVAPFLNDWLASGRDVMDFLSPGHFRNQQLSQWATSDGAALEARAADLLAQFLTRV